MDETRTDENENESQYICPKCAGKVPLDSIWTYQSRFYCGEDCALKAALPHQKYLNVHVDYTVSTEWRER